MSIVRQLDWYQMDKDGHAWGTENLLSEGGFGDYYISRDHSYYFIIDGEPMVGDDPDREGWDTVEEAKAAAQADFEKRILRCLIYTPMFQFHLGQLRHAYMQLKNGSVVRQAEFADGLIAPAIRAMEKIINDR